MKYKFVLFIICLLFILSSNLYGDKEKILPIPMALDAGQCVISAQDYILMPGDSILITISGSTNYSYITAVTLEGKVTVNMPARTTPTISPIGQHEPYYDIVNAVPIYNISLESAKDSLKAVFLKYFRKIDVDITLLSMRTFVVLVAGEVNRPGMVFARPIDRVSTIIDTVGNITPVGSHAKIKLIRNGKLFQMVNLWEFQRTGNTDVNPHVHDGDLIYVPRMEKSVTVIGAVRGKGEYEPTTSELVLTESELTSPRQKTTESRFEFIDGETVSDIIAKAGLLPWADLTSVFIQRKEQKIIINLEQVFADENSGYNILMEDGDVLHVPSINATVYVQGRVPYPGAFVFQSNLKATDYIGFAGGTFNDANMSSAYVQREKEKIPVKTDPIIEQGDRIIVPRQVIKFWQDYLTIGSVLASLLISYLTITAVSSN